MSAHVYILKTGVSHLLRKKVTLYVSSKMRLSAEVKGFDLICPINMEFLFSWQQV